MNLLESLPIRQYTVSLPPHTAVEQAVEHLCANGFTRTKYDLNAALVQTGFAPAGWTGQILTKGSGFRGFLVDAVPIVAAASFLPGVKNLHDTIYVSVLAKVNDYGQTELYCSYLNTDISENALGTRQHLVEMFETLPEALAKKGITVSAVTSPKAKYLPLEHPLNLHTWGKLFKAARRTK